MQILLENISKSKEEKENSLSCSISLNDALCSWHREVHCAAIYYIFKKIDVKHKEIDLIICRDFSGHENNIKQNLKHFLEKLDGRIIKSITFKKLPHTSNAHGYAYLMSKDKQNLLSVYVDISLEEMETFLKSQPQKKNKSRV